jgi:hypothetical protein
MRRLPLLATVVLVFGCIAMTQETGSTSNATATQSTKSKKSEAAAQDHQLTGCLAKDSSGKGFTLTSGRYKSGVAVMSGQDLGVHVGHMVRLTGTWQEPAPGGAGGSGAAGKPIRTFTADQVERVSNTCTVGASKAEAKKAGSQAVDMTTQ